MQCPQCGKQWPDTYKVCPECVLPLAPTVAAETIQGTNIVSGVQIIERQEIHPPGPDPQSWRLAYLAEVARETNRLPWTNVVQDYANPEQGEALSLADVYIGLDTTELERVKCEEELRRFLADVERGEVQRLSMQTLLAREPRILILGDPGSGKSTLLNHLAYTLAQAALADDPTDWLTRLDPWPHGVLLPIRVELRDLAAWAAEQPGAASLLNYLLDWLAANQLADFWSTLREAIRGETETLLFLLDGLDEVPTAQREAIVKQVQTCADRYPQHRYVVTCRPYAYVGQPWLLQGFKEVTLAPFDTDQIAAFIQAWYAELAQRERLTEAQAAEQTNDLQRVVQRRDLEGLAQRPLLLTVMTWLHTFQKHLPEGRSELYADAVELLLLRWERRVSHESGLLERLALPGLKLNDLKDGLYDVAFRAHSVMPEGTGTADISEGDLRQWLAPYLGQDWNKAGVFVEYIRERAGLLVRHKTAAYTFPHRTFQEYMAACNWVREVDYPTTAAWRVQNDPARWREVFVLAAGVARERALGVALAAVNALCPTGPEECKLTEGAAFHLAELAGETLLEIGLVGVQREPVGKAVLARVRRWLQAALRTGALLTPQQRAMVGTLLARLGDPRPEVTMLAGIEFCYVPGGPFWMGGNQFDTGKPLEINRGLDYGYWLARYPVTVAQWQACVTEGGVQPGNGDSLRGLANHPVVYVSWYEALEFCGWLTEMTRREGWLPEDWRIILPSEAEWEKAARGGVQMPAGSLQRALQAGLGAVGPMALKNNPMPKREFPWGDKADPNRSNYNETGIKQTSTVGCFSEGTSVYGVEELSGNVWEWTRSLWGKDITKPSFKYPYVVGDGREDSTVGDDVLRVLRGGAFHNHNWFVRCENRDRNSPVVRYDDVGFRVCAVPRQE